jgi:hypothetical protein
MVCPTSLAYLAVSSILSIPGSLVFRAESRAVQGPGSRLLIAERQGKSDLLRHNVRSDPGR